MIRHAFMLVWHRKRANALLILELFVTFLVLFAVSGVALNFYRLYQQPIGFRALDTWSVRISTGGGITGVERAIYRQTLAVVEQMDDVENVGLMSGAVFSANSSNMRLEINGSDTRIGVNSVSTGIPETIGMTLLQGRWFGPQDQVKAMVEPVLVNNTFAAIAGSEVLGTTFTQGEQKLQVIGVFSDFREQGEFRASRPFILQHLSADEDLTFLPFIIIKTKPGVDGNFEQGLLDTLQRVAPDWDFNVDTWDVLRREHRQAYLIPMISVMVIVGFLLLLVGFGLLGVLWQNVIRRTPEIGLRRAMGAPAGAVRLQVVLELMMVVIIAVVLGVAVTVQLPLAGLIRQLDWALYLPAAIVSTLVLLALCILFALYPSWQATRKDPVEALRYE